MLGHYQNSMIHGCHSNSYAPTLPLGKAVLLRGSEGLITRLPHQHGKHCLPLAYHPVETLPSPCSNAGRRLLQRGPADTKTQDEARPDGCRNDSSRTAHVLKLTA